MSERAKRIAAWAAVAGLPLLLGACGKTLQRPDSSGASSSLAAVGPAGSAGIVTKNTTRLGGDSPALDAAAVARAVYPGGKPQAVVLVDERDWPAALVAGELAGAPLRAPLIYTTGIVLPAASDEALERLAPAGAPDLGGVQAIRLGAAAGPPELRLRTIATSEPAELATSVERLLAELRGRRPRQVIVTALDAPAAMTAPAAALAAQTGAPILLVRAKAVPAATRSELESLGRPSIYVVGPASVVSARVARELRRFGPLTRIGGATPAANAIAVARFTDGAFGWGVEEPGHGLVFVNAARPLDGPAAAPLAASGDYAPVLLLDSSGRLSSTLARYVSDLQPGSPPDGPVRGVYNHAWLIGDDRAVPLATQARLDEMLEISPTRSGAEPALSPSSTVSEP